VSAGVSVGRRAALLAGLLVAGVVVMAENFDAARQAMVAEVRADFIATAADTGIPRMSAAVAQALGRVPRHEFVPPVARAVAYRNHPLAIGHDQTISQPYIVALMTELTRPRASARVLEIGTGSGYQAAILAELVAQVYSIEIVEPLALAARERLARLGYRNVSVRAGDGYQGWPEHAPFDAIVVTAAAAHVPQPLIDQLAPGGRLVIPVGPEGHTQELQVIEKQADGKTTTRRLLAVRFVPLTGEQAREPPRP
jgi:protein-L-isoaspartate(D-aspartate) O-methyltransferase